jgi:N-acetylmuramoyl-L-alanine amidase
MRTETKWLIVHSAATKPGMDIGVTQIRDWHKQRGWTDIGYAFVIRRSGAIEKGRDMEVVGAHTLNHNGVSVGICMAGGIDDTGKPDANFTDAQYTSLESLLTVLAKAYPGSRVRGHRNFAATACPSFDVVAWAQERGLPT